MQLERAQQMALAQQQQQQILQLQMQMQLQLQQQQQQPPAPPPRAPPPEYQVRGPLTGVLAHHMRRRAQGFVHAAGRNYWALLELV